MDFLVVLTVFSVLILVHEWGHFFAARKLGVKVEKFSIGFGKKLFSKKTRETEFMVCAVPLGGYVKLLGDSRTECKGNSAEFFSHPIWHRFIIVLMGPLVNFIFAYLCFIFIFWSGFPMLTADVGRVLPGPAQEAGVLPGDKILSIDGTKIKGWDEIPIIVKESNGAALEIEIERSSSTFQKTIVPRKRVLKNIFGKETELYLIGIQPHGDVIHVRYRFIDALGKGWVQIYKIITLTFRALYNVVLGSMPAKEALAGPIAIFGVIRDASAMGFSYLMLTVGLISTSLAIMNLFPIPALDGGHLFLFLIEKIRGKPLPEKIEEGMVRIGFGLLMCLMIFVLYNDIDRIGWIKSLSSFLNFKQ